MPDDPTAPVRRAARLVRTAPALLAAVLVVGCAGAPPGASPVPSRGSSTVAGATTVTDPTTSLPSMTTSLPSTTPVPVDPGAAAGSASSGSCHATGSGEEVLPDPGCTPGATNPAVTPATIHSTICVAGWTATVRPPESVTEPLKVAQMRAYGETGHLGSYEEDHLIPLELGGAPSDLRNLWPEPGASPNPKDAVESEARRAVCAGSLSLAVAQQAIARDWISLGRQLAGA